MSKRKVNDALRHVRRVEEAAVRLTEERITELVAKSRFTTVPDGFPRRTLADGMPNGDAEFTSVEAAGLTRGGLLERVEDDPVGRAIREVFDLLREMADRGARIYQKLDYLENYSKQTGRESSLAGECVLCGEVVSGAEHDRLRAGLCERHWKQWSRAGKPERAPWIAQVKRAEGEQAEEAS